MHFFFLAVVCLARWVPAYGGDSRRLVKAHVASRVLIFHQWYSRFQPSSRPAFCPEHGALEFEVQGLPRIIRSLGRAHARGMVATVFRTEDGLLAVKIGRPVVHPEYVSCIVDMQNRDRAALAALSGLDVAPEVYMPKQDSFRPGISRQCLSSLIVMDWVRGYALSEISVDSADIALIAQVAVQRLQKIHEAGILHGDIHLGNMMVSGGVDPSSLRFIDFGRAMPFRGPNNVNLLPASQMKAISNPAFEMHMIVRGLSVNELLGLPMSPNDDLFRLAEAMIVLAIGADEFYKGAPEYPVGLKNQNLVPMAQFKLAIECRSDIRIPPAVCALFERTRAAGYGDTPMYELGQ